LAVSIKHTPNQKLHNPSISFVTGPVIVQELHMCFNTDIVANINEDESYLTANKDLIAIAMWNLPMIVKEDLESYSPVMYLII
jgi:hypothetical protein